MVIVRSGAIARASCTASLASASRSTRCCSSGRCTSSRASSSRSSTSNPSGWTSLSIRDISMSTSRAAPWRYSSAKPRMVVSGVRSSWLASVMNRRIRSSEVRACSADASEDATASLNLCEHSVERQRKSPDLGSRITFGNTAIQLSRGDRRSGLLDLGQRSQAALHHREAGDAEHTSTATPMPNCNQTSDRTVCWTSDRSIGDGGQLDGPAHRHRPPQNIRASTDRHVAGLAPHRCWRGSTGSACAVVDGHRTRPSGVMPRT